MFSLWRASFSFLNVLTFPVIVFNLDFVSISSSLRLLLFSFWAISSLEHSNLSLFCFVPFWREFLRFSIWERIEDGLFSSLFWRVCLSAWIFVESAFSSCFEISLLISSSNLAKYFAKRALEFMEAAVVLGKHQTVFYFHILTL